jgi:aspartyl-tRNA(Asn)/glutamyl-tRNA(Gln) amidotransferase subunit A
MDFRGKTLTDLLSGDFDAQEVSNYFFQRISKHNKNLNVFIDGSTNAPEVTPERTGECLKGLPIALKDNVTTKSLPTTASSTVLKGYVSPYAATITHKLSEAGATILGKTNLDAWAHGSSTETSDFGPSRNPYHMDYVPGGSSGGSAAAVAAGLAPAAIGTETAGSTRLPAAWSGVVGLKPTYGRVSRHGIIAMGSSWDCPGPITQTVEDAALLLEIIAGHDPRDATSLDVPIEKYTDALSSDRKLTIGVAEEYFTNVEAEIAAQVRHCIKLLEARGHTIKYISLLDPKYAVSVYMLLQRSEVSSNLARYTGVRYGKDRSAFGPEARRRIMLGTYALSAGYYDEFYKKAQKVRYVIREDFKRVFEEVDVIIAPTVPITATKIGDHEKFAFYGEMMDILTEPASAAGIPAISIPSGMHSNGLPMAVQFMGRHLEEATILQIAHELESELKFDRLAVMQNYD